jgi:DNA-binding NarL/FixJ family response regulator
MTTDKTTRVLIVDDHAMVRLALAETLQQHDDLELVGEAENGEKAVEL